MPKLLVTLPDGSEVSHELGEDTVTIGRLADNAIQIDDGSVSSHHAELTLKGEDYVLRDLNSTNGTRLNGKTVEAEREQPLQAGDKLRLGNITALYASETAAEQRPMPEEMVAAVAPAATSVAPSDFTNASPFLTKHKKRDPAATLVYAFAVVALLVFAGAAAMVISIKPPL